MNLSSLSSIASITGIKIPDIEGITNGYKEQIISKAESAFGIDNIKAQAEQMINSKIESELPDVNSVQEEFVSLMKSNNLSVDTNALNGLTFL